MKHVATLFLGGIEDGEYGEIDIESVSGHELEEMQERLVTGSDDVRVPLFLIGEPTNEMIDAACAAVPCLYRVDAMHAIEAALEAVGRSMK